MKKIFNIYKCLFAVCICLGINNYAYALEPVDTTLNFNQKFIINSGDINSVLQLEDFLKNIENVELRDTTVHIDIIGRASIDGRTEHNERLALERAEILRDALIDLCKVEPYKISVSSLGEDWKLFETLVLADENIPARNRVLSTIHSDFDLETKESRIRGFAEGDTWEYLSENIFPEMRVATVSWQLSKRVLPAPEVEEENEADSINPVEPEISENTIFEIVEQKDIEEWVRKLYLKTNAPAWACLWVNAAVEVDLAPHWSAQLPIYWAGWNYFKRTLKFRTLAFVPEVRWWPKRDNMGFFANVHLGLAWYNYAGDGEYRYQDKDGRNPAIGGGVGVGYRFYFCKNHRWSMEAGVGAGVYRLKYDMFENRPNGPLVGWKSRTFFGIDQAFLSFCYSFGI